MRRKVWLAIALVKILPVVLFMFSCTKTMVQTQPVSTAKPEVQKAPDRSAEEAEQAERLREDRLRAEAAARDAAETAFVDENIYFAFDSTVLSDQAQQILNSKADYLRTNPDITITVEGHCDDRGTDAYNIDLGERRAESVKIYLAWLGIATNRLNTVSYGEERPIATRHDEASWAKNRRAEFVIN
ncbi:MAG TPA: peptidoglycan-associated lipoprotein Pal [Anaerolineales bacterium]|nr:peptidoglycan-associated lipoprotein Pal [Anaerolineales bacterium]